MLEPGRQTPSCEKRRRLRRIRSADEDAASSRLKIAASAGMRASVAPASLAW